MKKEYTQAGIAGKFRMLHIAHEELVIRATSKTEHLHVFIVDVPEYQRYSTVEQVQETFETIFANIDFKEFSIHIINEELSGKAWDQRVLELAPQIEVMFDSKEKYENVLIKNEYIELSASKDISVSSIEKRPFERYNASLVVPYFWQFMARKVELVDKDNERKDYFIKKLSLLFSLPDENEAKKNYQHRFGRIVFTEKHGENCDKNEIFSFVFKHDNNKKEEKENKNRKIFQVPSENEYDAFAFVVRMIELEVLGGKHE